MVSEIKFNKFEYVELLTEVRVLNDRKKSFSIESLKLYEKYLNYSIIMSDQVSFNNKNKYVFLIKEYLEVNICVLKNLLNRSRKST